MEDGSIEKAALEGTSIAEIIVGYMGTREDACSWSELIGEAVRYGARSDSASAVLYKLNKKNVIVRVRRGMYLLADPLVSRSRDDVIAMEGSQEEHSDDDTRLPPLPPSDPRWKRTKDALRELARTPGADEAEQEQLGSLLSVIRWLSDEPVGGRPLDEERVALIRRCGEPEAEEMRERVVIEAVAEGQSEAARPDGESWLEIGECVDRLLGAFESLLGRCADGHVTRREILAAKAQLVKTRDYVHDAVEAIARAARSEEE